MPLSWQEPGALQALLDRLRGPEPLEPLLLLLDRGAVGGHPPPADLRALLPWQDQQRLEAFRRPEDQQRFLLGRGCLRLILGRLLGRDPARLPLVCGPHGKPALAEAEGPCFNLSHAGDLVLLAFHPRRPVGVDVERLRPTLDWRPIARRVLTQAECETLEGQAGDDPSAADRAFLQAWCRLEARLKALGVGLGGLSQLEGETVDPAPEDVWDVIVPVGYRAAVALMPPA